MSIFSYNWLRYLRPTATPPKTPTPVITSRKGSERTSREDDYTDFTFGTQASITGGMKPAEVQGILDQANTGECQQQALMIKDIQEKEPIISAHLGTRRGAVHSKTWSVTSVENPDQAAEIELMFTKAGIHDAICYLTDYISTGYAMMVIDWETGAGQVNGFLPIAPECIEFDYGGNIALRNLLGMDTPKSNYHQYQFLTAKSTAKPGLPCRNGLVRTLAWMYYFKHQGIAGWTRYIEKYGVPFQLVTLPKSQWETRITLLASMKSLGRDGVGIMPEGAKMELLDTSNGNSQETFLRYCDEVITLTILGQLGTSAKSTGFSNGGSQDSVRSDLLASDCQTMIDVVQKQLLVPLCQYRYGWEDARDIQFWLDYEKKEDLEAKAKMYLTLTQVTGRKIKSDQIAEEFGVEFEEAMIPSQPEVPVATPGE